MKILPKIIGNILGTQKVVDAAESSPVERRDPEISQNPSRSTSPHFSIGLFKYFFIYFVVQFGVLIILDTRYRSTTSPYTFLLIKETVQYFFLLVIGIILSIDLRRNRILRIPLRRPNLLSGGTLPSVVGLGVAITLFTFIAAHFIIHVVLGAVMPQFSYFFNKGDSYWDYAWQHLVAFPSLLLMLQIGLIGPIFEEIFFRWVMIHKLGQRMSTGAAVVISASVFAILHPLDVFGTFVIAMGMSFLYLRTRTLFYPILVHVINNLGVIAVNAVPFLSHWDDRLHDALSHPTPLLVIQLSGIAVILFAIIAIYFRNDWRRLKEPLPTIERFVDLGARP